MMVPISHSLRHFLGIIRFALCESNNYIYKTEVQALYSSDYAGEEGCKIVYVTLDTGAFERRHIFVSYFFLNDSPSIPSGGQHYVHHKSSHSSVSVHIRVYESED